MVIALTGVLTFLATRTPDQIRAQAQADYERAVEGCVARGGTGLVIRPGEPTVEVPIAPAPGGPGAGAAPGAAADARLACERLYRPGRDRRAREVFELATLWPSDPPAPEPAEEEPPFPDLGYLFGGFLIMPAWLLLIGGLAGGASMVGAEWQAGSLVTQLTWEPRRARVLVARLVATGAVGFVLALVMLSLFTAALVPAAALRGAMPPDRHWWLVYAGTVLRLSGLVALAAFARRDVGSAG